MLNEKCEAIDDAVREKITDSILDNGDYGYFGDCDRGFCDDCSSWSDGHSEGYDEGYLDALEGNDHEGDGRTYVEEVTEMNKRKAEARKAETSTGGKN